MKLISAAIYIATKKGIIKSNADFYNNYYCNGDAQSCYNLLSEFASSAENEAVQSSDIGIISIFDDLFPYFNPAMKNSEKPYLLFYRGNIELLSDVEKNVAVIGLVDPSDEIIERERNFVKLLVNGGCNIVSGLANGCDTIAHESCLEYLGKTIAILPSTLQKISPAKNKALAENIVNCGGLLISEYFEEPKSRFDATKRFIDRDRLQALFSHSIVLTASYRQGEGDAGSRHAMGKAKEYGRKRYMMYNASTDSTNPMFGLNFDYLHSEKDVRVLTKESLKEIISPLQEWKCDYYPELFDILIFDLEGTLFFTDQLNTASYNSALSEFGYPAIKNKKRITRNIIKEVYPDIAGDELTRLCQLKQEIFLTRLDEIQPNEILLNILNSVEISRVAILTSSDLNKVKAILTHFDLEKIEVIIQKTTNVQDSLTELTQKFNVQISDFVFFDDDKTFVQSLRANKCRVFTN